MWMYVATYAVFFCFPSLLVVYHFTTILTCFRFILTMHRNFLNKACKLPYTLTMIFSSSLLCHGSGSSLCPHPHSLHLFSLSFTAQPSLVSFSLSLTPPEVLTLTFDTALTDSTCDVSKLTLQNSSTLIIGGFYSPQVWSYSHIEYIPNKYLVTVELLYIVHSLMIT